MMAKLFALVYCDNFLINCEQIFNPALVGKPVVIISGNRGWVVARSPAAQSLGINPGMCLSQVEAIIQKQREKHSEKYNVIVHGANSSLYADISNRVMSALQQFCPELEIYDQHAAWLELTIAPVQTTDNFTGEPVLMPDAISISDYAQEIRRKINQWIGVPISIGIAPTKTLAKVAQQIAQQSASGITSLLTKSSQAQALAATAVGKIWGIDSYYAQQLEAIGITNALQLRMLPEKKVQALFDPGMSRTIDELHGQVHYPLQPIASDRQLALMFRAFAEPVDSIALLKEVTANYVAILAQKLHAQELLTTGISITLATDQLAHLPQYCNSTQIKLEQPTNDASDLTRQAIAALTAVYQPGLAYKKISIKLWEPIASNGWGWDLGQSPQRSTKQRENRLIGMVEQAKLELEPNLRSASKADGLKINHQTDRQEVQRSQRYTTAWSELPIAKA
ncbi:Y-family DNA polymerase [Thalassoporum mexicanum]|uniref:Y-family DNA polymerase n=2 Tax=Thalassoporum mexicanum TaxID=3457544 RepID=UPI00059EDC29|nr:hypothetical protein [Pseudanabaena sp. PCC 7367]